MSNPQVQSLTVNGTTYDIVDNTSGYMTGMTILSYGNSTWQDFIDAYTAKKVVYCRASSQSNPGTGSQTRLAFMAYVNDADNPTSVEFQYYRSVSTKTESQQGDQVFIYTLTSSGSWSVITREASVKVAVGGDLNGSYSGGTYTISADIPDQNVISVDQKVTTGVNIADIIINGTATALYAPQGGGSGTITRVKTTAGAHTAIDVSSGSASFNIPTNTSHLVNDSGFITSYTDTKNTAGSTNSTSKLYLIGATSQAANPQTYSNSYLYYSSGLKSTVSSGNGAASCDINQTATSITLKYDGTSSGNKLTIENNKIEISGNVYLSNYGDSYSTNILSSATSSNKTITFPNATGTVALTSDIPTVPTKTSDLTNDSGFITSYTDTKNTAGSTNSTSQLYLIGATEQSANSQTYSNDGLYIDNAGTLITQSLTSYGSVVFSPGTSEYTFGNNYFNLSTKVYTQEDVSDSVRGAFIVGDYTGLTLGSYKGNNYSDITTYLRVSSEDETIEITNLATPSNNTDAANKKYVDDSIGAIPAASITLNGTSTTSASFYAPTTVGTWGQVLRSNGTGAPAWVTINEGAQVQIVRW